MTMRLTKDEEKMLSGGYGEGYKRAMEILVEMGEFYDAKRHGAHQHGVPGGGAERRSPGRNGQMAELDGRYGDVTFKCPLCLAPIEGQPFSDYDLQKRLGAVFASGSGGHARNPFCLPVRGQHITADGTAVTHYMNSYIGARANTECFIGQYCAAITGKTPEYGFHLPENRLGKTLFEIKMKLKDETDWSALGYYISRTLAKNYWDVPVINGIDPLEITNDDLVTFCESVPSYGAVVHSLLVGVSPEGQTLKQAFGGRQAQGDLRCRDPRSCRESTRRSRLPRKNRTWSPSAVSG